MKPTLGGHPLATAVWLMVGALGVAAAAGVAGGILSPVLILDLASMWPLTALALALGGLGQWRARRPRGRALLPLALFTSLVLGVALHLAGWEYLPSSATTLVGPPSVEASDPTEIRVNISGELVVAAASGPAYRIEPILRGGSVGLPTARETYVDGELSVWVEETSADPWYSFAGWRLHLSPEVSWKLILNGAIDADLTALSVESAAIAGSGQVRLGRPPLRGGGLIVAGKLTLTVPPDAAVVVTGPVFPPPGWASNGEGATSPGGAEGDDQWRISVQGEDPLVVRVSG